MRAGIQPGVPPPHDLNTQLAALKIDAINVSDFPFPSCGRFEVRHDIDHSVVIEIEAGYGIVALRADRFLFQ